MSSLVSFGPKSFYLAQASIENFRKAEALSMGIRSHRYQFSWYANPKVNPNKGFSYPSKVLARDRQHQSTAGLCALYKFVSIISGVLRYFFRPRTTGLSAG